MNMKRRSFLKGLLGVTASAPMPVKASSIQKKKKKTKPLYTLEIRTEVFDLGEEKAFVYILQNTVSGESLRASVRFRVGSETWGNQTSEQIALKTLKLSLLSQGFRLKDLDPLWLNEEIDKIIGKILTK